ncbi:hypothetical protein INT47_012960 [Mucor saturninus]|uniref:Uncharacterized protein n=1 Tax=Mucor saturninus TaxID=64648 RepID=A0A8H7UUQ8_9FUNG|nr:hypothetical protein INT47_012960 [Mucor saturninus]
MLISASTVTLSKISEKKDTTVEVAEEIIDLSQNVSSMPEAKTIYYKSTQKFLCPSSVTLFGLTVTKSNMIHNHPISQDVTTYAIHRKQSPEIMARIYSLLSSGHKDPITSVMYTLKALNEKRCIRLVPSCSFQLQDHNDPALLFIVTTSPCWEWVICAPAAFLGCGSRFSGSLSGIEPQFPGTCSSEIQERMTNFFFLLKFLFFSSLFLDYYTHNMQNYMGVDYFNSTAVKDWNILHCLKRVQVGVTSTNAACDSIELTLKEMTKKRTNLKTAIKAMWTDLDIRHSSRKCKYGGEALYAGVDKSLGVGGDALGVGVAVCGGIGEALVVVGAYHGVGGEDLGAGGEDLGAGGEDLGAGGEDLGAGGEDLGAGGEDLGAGGEDLGAGGEDLGVGGENLGIINYGNNRSQNNNVNIQQQSPNKSKYVEIGSDSETSVVDKDEDETENVATRPTQNVKYLDYLEGGEPAIEITSSTDNCWIVNGDNITEGFHRYRSRCI